MRQSLLSDVRHFPFFFLLSKALGHIEQGAYVLYAELALEAGPYCLSALNHAKNTKSTILAAVRLARKAAASLHPSKELWRVWSEELTDLENSLKKSVVVPLTNAGKSKNEIRAGRAIKLAEGISKKVSEAAGQRRRTVEERMFSLTTKPETNRTRSKGGIRKAKN
jgi:hypothetical protein